MFNVEQTWGFVEVLGVDIDALVGHEAANNYADSAQAALNSYRKLMNDKGRSAPLKSAELMCGSPDTYIEKDRPESTGIPLQAEGVA